MASFNIGRFIKNPKKGLENAFRSVGKVNKDIAPYVGMIPGVGPALGAATGAWGSLLSGGNMKSHLKSGVAGGLSGLANTQLLGGRGIKGIGSLAGNLGGKGGLGSLGSLGGGSGASAAGGGGFLGGLKSVGKFALGNPDLILGGLSAVEGYKKGRNADRMLDRALNDPSLRPARPDYSDVFSGYSNAYTGGSSPMAPPAVGGMAGPLRPVLPPNIEEMVAVNPISRGGGRIRTVGKRKPMLEEAY